MRGGGRRSLMLTTTANPAFNKKDTSERTTEPEDDNDKDESEGLEEDAEKPAKVCSES